MTRKKSASAEIALDRGGFVDRRNIEPEASSADSAPVPSAEIALANAGAFRFLSGAALKIFLALRAAGDDGSAQCADIAKLAGIGKRTVAGAMEELAANGWLEFIAERGEGYCWRMLSPPQTMTKNGRTYYKIKIAQKKKKLDDQEIELLKSERDELRAEQKSMHGRLDALFAQATSGVK